MKTMNDIEQLLKPKVAYHASPKVKERVMDEVAKTATPIGSNNHRWWRWVSVAASLLIVAGMGWMLLNQKSKDESQIADVDTHTMTDSSTIYPIVSPSEEVMKEAPLTAQVEKPSKSQKRVKRQTAPHEMTNVDSSIVDDVSKQVEQAEFDELKAMLNEMQQHQSMMSEEEEYMHMNVKVFTANIRIRNKQELKN